MEQYYREKAAHLAAQLRAEQRKNAQLVRALRHAKRKIQGLLAAAAYGQQTPGT